MSGSRPWTLSPVQKIKNVQDYGERFVQWWHFVQPPSRNFDSETGQYRQVHEADVDWDDIRLSGRNGLWTAIAGLCHWGLCLRSEDARQSCRLWQYALADIDWVLQELARVPSSEAEPASSSKPSTTPSSKPKRGRPKKSEEVVANDAGEESSTTLMKPKRGRPRKTHEVTTSGVDDERISTRAAKRKREVENERFTRSKLYVYLFFLCRCGSSYSLSRHITGLVLVRSSL